MTEAVALQAFKEEAQHPDPEEAARAVACRRVYENAIRRQLRLELLVLTPRRKPGGTRASQLLG